MNDSDDITNQPCPLFPGNPTYGEMAETVAARRAADPEFDAQCRQDIEDFFRPSLTAEAIRKWFKEQP